MKKHVAIDSCIVYMYICQLKHIKTVLAYLLMSVYTCNNTQHLSITFGEGGVKIKRTPKMLTIMNITTIQRKILVSDQRLGFVYV